MGCRVWGLGLGFRVWELWDSGFGGLGFRVWGLGLRDLGVIGFRGLGFRVWGASPKN